MLPAAILSILVRSDGATAAVARLRVLDTATRTTSAGMDRVTASSNAASASQGRLAAAAGKGRAGLAAASRGAGLVALGVGAIGAASVKAAADYESSMNTLRAVSGATGDEMARLSKLSKQLGADIQLPGTSAQDAAEAMTEMIKAGVSVNDTMAGVRSTLVLSAAAQIGNAEAAEIASNALNTFKLRGQDVAMVADQLANTANSSSVEITDVADAMKMAGAVFSGFQGPVLGAKGALTELNVAVGLLGNAGIKGSDAGTSLKQALLQLTGPSEKSKSAMEALYGAAQHATGAQEALSKVEGGSAKERNAAIQQLKAMNPELKKGGDIAYDSAGRMRSLKDILRLVTAGTKGLTQELYYWYLTQIFGADATRSIIALMQAGPAAWDKMTAAVTKQGAAQDLAAAKMKGLKGSFDALKSTLQTLAITFGTVLLPALTAALRGFTNLLSGIDPKVLGITIAAIGGLTAGIWLLNAALAANPVGLVIAGLILLGAGLVTAYQKVEAFRNVVDTAFAALKTAVLAIIPVAATVGGALTTAFSAVVGAFRAVVGAVRTAVNATITEIGRWKVAFAVVGVIVDVVRSAFAPLAIIVRAYLGAVLEVVGAIMHQVVNAFRTAWNVVKAMFSGTFTVLKSIVLGFGQILHGAIEVIGGILKGDFHQIWEGVKDIFRGAITATTGILRGAVSAYVGAAKAIGQGIVNGIKAALGDIGHVILDRLKEAADWLKDKVGGLFGFIGGAVSKVTGDGIGKEARKMPKMGKAGNLMGANRALAPVAGIGAGFGLRVSSGLRPGSVTSSGNTSYHSSGEALDMAGDPKGMLGFFRSMRSRFGSRLAELIYTPGGAGIKDGQSHTYTGRVAADHYDHVHVAMDLGKPGVGDGPGRERARTGKFMGDGLGSNARRIFAFFKSQGFTDAQAAAWVGNFQQESSLDPSRLQGGGGPGRGLAQWGGGRFTALQTFARKRGKPWTDLQTQLAFVMHELHGKESKAFGAIKGTRTIDAAVNAIGTKYERYGIAGDRSGPARAAFKAFAGTGGAGGTTTGPTRASMDATIRRNQDRIDRLRQQARHLPGGRKGRAQRVQIQDQISKLLQRNRHIREQIKNLPKDETVQRVSKFDQMQADAALRAAQVQQSLGVTDLSPEAFTTDAGGYNIAAAKKAAAALLPQQKALGFRINQLQTALRQRGHSAAARTRWKNELAEKLPQYQQIQQQRKDLLTGPADQSAPITQEDIINQHLAQATLTPGSGDDQAAAAEMLDYRQGIYLKALQGGDPRQIAQAADDLKNAMDANTSAQQEQIDAMKAHTDALKSVADELKRGNDTAARIQSTDAFTMRKYLADLLSGQIVGYGVIPRSSTPGYGVEARY